MSPARQRNGVVTYWKQYPANPTTRKSRCRCARHHAARSAGHCINARRNGPAFTEGALCCVDGSCPAAAKL